MRGDHYPDVQRYRVQPDVHAQRAESGYAGGGWAGGAPVLAAGRDRLLARSQVLPVFALCADLLAGLPRVGATLPAGVRAGACRLRAHNERVQLPLAGAHGVRPVTVCDRAHLHGPEQPDGRGESHGRTSSRSAGDAETVRTPSGTPANAAAVQAWEGWEGLSADALVSRSAHPRARTWAAGYASEVGVRVPMPAATRAHREGLDRIQPQYQRRWRRELCVPVSRRILFPRGKRLRRSVDSFVVGTVCGVHPYDADHVPHRAPAIQVP